MGSAARELGDRIAASKRLSMDLRFTMRRADELVIRGEETASFDRHDDGCISFRASSRSFSPPVLRDVIYTLTPDYRPIDAFVRLQVEGRYEGSGFFRFGRDETVSMTWNREAGIEQSSVATPDAVGAFCAHPVTTDALLTAAFDHSSSSARQSPGGVYLSSADPFGRTGPQLSSSSLSIEYAGLCDIETPLGAVSCDEYRLYEHAAATSAVQVVWVVCGTSIFVSSVAASPYNTRYELTGLRLEA